MEFAGFPLGIWAAKEGLSFFLSQIPSPNSGIRLCMSRHRDLHLKSFQIPPCLPRLPQLSSGPQPCTSQAAHTHPTMSPSSYSDAGATPWWRARVRRRPRSTLDGDKERGSVCEGLPCHAVVHDDGGQACHESRWSTGSTWQEIETTG